MKHLSGQQMKRLGRFEILAPIGAGGMASIFLARIAGPAGFQKPIALKVILTHLAEDARFIEMFLNEANIAAELQHRNIVQIYELGESDGVYFISMEYLRGENVSDLIKRVLATPQSRMDVRHACHIIMESCEGLHHAHNTSDVDGKPMKVVHRDISPQNLFVTYSGDVKVMDFGIARAAGYAGTTKPGCVKGKFSYMSPEQTEGGDLDHRIDIFALGVVLWEMLACRRLFQGRHDLDTVRLLREGSIPRLTQIRPDVPAALEPILDKAMARAREERFQTAMELHEALVPVVDQLGGALSTHDLAGWMGELFPDEERKKKSLLSKTMKDSGGVRSPFYEEAAPDDMEEAVTAEAAGGATVESSAPEPAARQLSAVVEPFDTVPIPAGLLGVSDDMDMDATFDLATQSPADPKEELDLAATIADAGAAMAPDISEEHSPTTGRITVKEIPSRDGAHDDSVKLYPPSSMAQTLRMQSAPDMEAASPPHSEPAGPEPPPRKGGVHTGLWIIAAVVVVLGLAAGAGLATLWGNHGDAEPATPEADGLEPTRNAALITATEPAGEARPQGAAAQPVTISVIVEPAGAAVSLDGRPMGQAPVDLIQPYSEGQHDLLVQARGFDSKTVKVAFDGSRRVDIIMRPESGDSD